MNAVLAALHTDASYLVAAALVAFYAASRFNTPRTVRSQTSRFQYFGSCAIYIASGQGLLMLVSWLLTQNSTWLGFLHFGATEAMPDQLSGLDAPLVAALMLTTLLPSFPVLRDVDSAMLRFFHKMGAIPFGALRWAARMDETPFAVTERLLADARTFVTNSRDLPDSLAEELRSDPADGIRFLFTRDLVLYAALTNLKNRAGFGDEFSDDMAAFEKKLGGFFIQCVGYFAFIDQLTPAQLAAVKDSVDKFRSLILDAHGEILEMLARVLLYSSNDDGEVADKLAGIGFSIPRPAPVKVPMNLLCLDAVGVLVLFAGSTFLSAGEMGPGKAIAIGLLVAIIHSIAAMVALLPKQIWGFADIRCAHERPILAYIVSGLCALTIALPILYGFYLLRVNFLAVDSGPIMAFSGQCKWLLLSTVLAVALAFACDDFAEAKREPGWLRWAEGAGIAGLMAITGMLVMRWLESDQALLHPGQIPPSLWVPVLLSASIGALFGATIPHWYRLTVRNVEAAQAPLPQAIPGAEPMGAHAGGSRA